jgi:hypothetical protein
MVRDWVLTLLVLSPMLLALAIVLFALLGRVARHEPARAAGVEQPHPERRLS